MEEAFMRRAIELARIHMRQRHGGPFGAVVVKDGAIIGEGWNAVAATHDPTAHAEIVAIRAATARLGSFDLHGADLYASCQPCPMCLAAAYWARVSRIYVAASGEDAAAIGFGDGMDFSEIVRSGSERSASAPPRHHVEALGVFAEWQAMDDKPVTSLGPPLPVR